MAAIEVNCGSCNKTTSGKFSYGAVGLRTYLCPECKTKHQFGLSNSTEKLYIGFSILILAAFVTGIIQSLGFLLLFAGYALYKNYQITNSPTTAKIVPK